MRRGKLHYYGQEDIVHLVLADGREVDSIELSPTITAELNAQGEVIGVEVLDASAFIHDTLLALLQAHGLSYHSAAPEEQTHATGCHGTPADEIVHSAD